MMFNFYIIILICFSNTACFHKQYVQRETHKLQSNIIEYQFKYDRLMTLKNKFSEDIRDANQKLNALVCQLNNIKTGLNSNEQCRYAKETQSRISLIKKTIQTHMRTITEIETEIESVKRKTLRSKEQLQSWTNLDNHISIN